MPSAANSQILLGVLGYFCGVAAVVIGGVYGAGILLSTVPKPGFLTPEYDWDSRSANLTPVPEPVAMVVAKPYKPPNLTPTRWRGSVIAAYSASSAAKSTKAQTARPGKKATKSSKRKARKHKRRY